MNILRSTFALSLGLAIVALPVSAAPASPSAAAASPQSWKDLLNQIKGKSASTSAANLSNSEVVGGLKEALAKGTTRAINSLGRKDGFWGNPGVRIPLPGKLQQAAKLARQLGQGDKVDAFQLSMNRAAEKAVPQVADLFGDAIRQMTLQDARAILGGGDHAATDYFRRVAGPKLAERIRPIVARATDSVGVTQRYKSLMAGSTGGTLGSALSMLGKSGASKDMDLDTYVTDEALNGLFKTIGNEEQSIRQNPAARTTDLLKKVFGSR
ncbi:DUF4197 domain-containing protein [Oleiagrimonas soli]|uniref:DUF4197 domain-containing protein n=1 Tax=Oleiagrimonas soli TaxID=1543381 RepID=A0A099CYA1_9GAMM|nr:DUF4197 domain-containing protein [Oleiagrimonas soli]KGI78557.1 hypothetical protein LF63_0103610 [Oleiagrimonas soli]MBB6184164.1 hypothetical protein [Oleiagrimonas soli]